MINILAKKWIRKIKWWKATVIRYSLINLKKLRQSWCVTPSQPVRIVETESDPTFRCIKNRRP